MITHAKSIPVKRRLSFAQETGTMTVTKIIENLIKIPVRLLVKYDIQELKASSHKTIPVKKLNQR